MEMLLQAILTLLGRVEENQRDRRGRLRDAFWLGVLRGVGSLLGFAVAARRWCIFCNILPSAICP